MHSRTVLAVLAWVVLGWAGTAATFQVGTGRPNLDGWCALPWHATESSGLVGLTAAGLELRGDLYPPRSAFELSLKTVSADSLLFLFESPNTAGEIVFYLEDRVVQKIRPPQSGLWWIRARDLPPTGILRVELGAYVKSLLIRSVYLPCQKCPVPDCGRWAVLGALVGAGAVLLLLWISGRL